MPAPAAPENGPAPTPARAVYGFLLYVASVLAAGVYLTWALVPPGWLRALGLDYWPQQLWALTVPTALLAALFLFVMVIYPLLGLLDAPGLGDPRVHVDEFSLPVRPAAAGGIPPVGDIPLSEACRHLYLDGVTETGWEESLPSEEEDPSSHTAEAASAGWAARRQSLRHWQRDVTPRLRSWSDRDAAPADQRGNGDVRWRGRDAWRVRRRRREDSGDGLSAGADS